MIFKTPYPKKCQLFIILLAFLVNSLGPMPLAPAQEFKLPAPGVMVHLSPPLEPPVLKGIKVHPDNPLRFDFIMDVGDGSKPSPNGRVMGPPLQYEATKLIKYFLASLTIPEQDLWVNLSPYEKERIIPQSFGLTEMGRDLLAEDYMLKQITASLIYPEDSIGKKFWKRIYEEAFKKFGTTNVPVNTFNKVWIIPQKAVVYENAKAGTAYVVESKLKVMLEEDYLSLSNHECRGGACLRPQYGPTQGPPLQKGVNALGSQIVREIVIPELTREVNENKNFAQLRQVYNSLILATWYKKKIKESILAQVYADKKKVAGVEYDKSVIFKNTVILSEEKDLNKINSLRDSSASPQNDTELIYQRYLQAFKKGAFNYIKEDPDPLTQQIIPRKYFSGGTALALISTLEVFDKKVDPAQTGTDPKRSLDLTVDFAMQGDIQGNAIKTVAKDFAMETKVWPSGQRDLYYYHGRSFPPEELPSARIAIRNVLKKANGITQINGPFTTQQYIPLTLRDSYGQEGKPLDIHGGDALWSILKDLLQSQVFKEHFLEGVQGLSLEGAWDKNDTIILSEVFLVRKWISKDEKTNLDQYTLDLFRLLRPYLGSSNDINERQYVKYSDISQRIIEKLGQDPYKIEEFYKEYYEKTQYIYDVLTRVLARITQEAVPNIINWKDIRTEVNWEREDKLPRGFYLGKLRQGVYISPDHQFHFLGPGDRPVDIIDFPYEKKPGENLAKILEQRPDLLVKIFRLAVDKDAVISPRLLLAIAQTAAAMNDEGPTPLMEEEFIKLLRSEKRKSLVLLQMYETGVLGKFFPELDNLKFHFEVPSHRFSVPLHTLYLIYTLENVIGAASMSGEDKRLYIANQVYQKVSKSTDLLKLLLGILLHDLDKNGERDRWASPHDISAAQSLVPRALSQFRSVNLKDNILESNEMNDTQESKEMDNIQEFVVDEVGNHPFWNFRARNTRRHKSKGIFSSDLLDTLQLGNNFSDKNFLGLFYLISVADAMSVDPQNEIYLKEGGGYDVTTQIFQQLLEYLDLPINKESAKETSEGQEIKETMAEKKEIWEGEAAKETNEIKYVVKVRLKNELTLKRSEIIRLPDLNSLLDQYVSMFTGLYFRTNIDFDIIISQFELFVAVCNAPKTHLETGAMVYQTNTEHGPLTELLVGMNHDRPGIMSEISGALAGVGFNVIRAEINTTSDGAVFDRLNGYFLPNAPDLETICEDLNKYISDRLSQINKKIQMASPGEDIRELQRQEKELEFPHLDWKNETWDNVLPIIIKLIVAKQISADELIAFNGAVKTFNWLEASDFYPVNVIFASMPGQPNVSTVTLRALKDHLGLLYNFYRPVFERFGLNIKSAPIKTIGGKVEDSFIVSKIDGSWLGDDKKAEIAEFLEVLIGEPTGLTQEDIIRASKPVERGSINTPEDWVDSLRVPFHGLRYQAAVNLAKELISQNPREWNYKYKKSEIAKGDNFSNLLMAGPIKGSKDSLKKFVELVNISELGLVAKAISELSLDNYDRRHNAEIYIRNSDLPLKLKAEALMRNFIDPKVIGPNNYSLARVGSFFNLRMLLEKREARRTVIEEEKERSDLRGHVLNIFENGAKEWLLRMSIPENSPDEVFKEWSSKSTPQEEKLLKRTHFGHADISPVFYSVMTQPGPISEDQKFFETTRLALLESRKRTGAGIDNTIEGSLKKFFTNSTAAPTAKKLLGLDNAQLAAKDRAMNVVVSDDRVDMSNRIELLRYNQEHNSRDVFRTTFNSADSVEQRWHDVSNWQKSEGESLRGSFPSTEAFNLFHWVFYELVHNAALYDPTIGSLSSLENTHIDVTSSAYPLPDRTAVVRMEIHQNAVTKDGWERIIRNANGEEVFNNHNMAFRMINIYLDLSGTPFHVQYRRGPSSGPQGWRDLTTTLWLKVNRMPAVHSTERTDGLKDKAAVAKSNEGGIDLTPANMDVQIKKEIASSLGSTPRNDTSEGIKFHLDPAMLEQLQNATGFSPVIVDVRPLKSLSEFLEFASSN